MRTPRRCVVGLMAASLALLGVASSGSGAWPQSGSPAPITDRQDPSAGPPTIGAPAAAHRLARKPSFQPRIAAMHADAGNTNVTDYPGPLGRGPVVASAQILNVSPFLWGPDGSLTSGCVEPQPDGTVIRCLGALDPRTLMFTAQWEPPPGQVLNLAYLVMDGHNRVVASTMQGHIFVVQRRGGPAVGRLQLVRDIDLTSQLQPGELLFEATPDAAGRIWFTTGGILGIGDQPAPFTTFGYVTPSGQIHTEHLADQIVEKGFAVDGTTIYLVSGPAGSADHPQALGSLYAFTATGGGTGIKQLWHDDYEAGSGRKPGVFNRGSGTSVVLVGTDYVTIVDNADVQDHVLVYRRHDGRRVCSVPVFAAGQSAVNVAPISVRTGNTHSLVVTNLYNAPPIMLKAADFNGTADDMSAMAPGVARIDVRPNGSCRTVWNQPVRTKTVPFLSTATGLVYGYTQDEQLASQGSVVWYFVAFDYRTGRVVWRVRAGAGTLKNDNYSPMSIGPDGTLYQQVPFGVIWLKDGPRR